MVPVRVRPAPSWLRLDPARLHDFDLLQEDDELLFHFPYRRRRERLQELQLSGASWQTTDTFDDGAALFACVCERGLEGIIAKPSGSVYRPGYRGWLKIKNTGYWRRPEEVALAERHRRRSRTSPMR